MLDYETTTVDTAQAESPDAALDAFEDRLLSMPRDEARGHLARLAGYWEHAERVQVRDGADWRRLRLQLLRPQHLRARAHIAQTPPRPAGAAREHRASPSKSSRGGDSGDSSDEGEPGPGSGRQLSSTDARRTLAERRAALDALTGGKA